MTVVATLGNVAETPSHSDTYGLAAYHIDAYVPERLVEEMYDGRTLGRLLARKLARRVTPRRLLPRSEERIAAYYDGIAVFDRPEQHKGGLAFGQDVPRVLNELGIGRCGRLFEFCAGPGYIGYSLLAAGWCETLVLSDIDAGAVAAARHTASHNLLEDRVAIYESDVLDQIPDGERWDLVVANPPHFLPDPERSSGIDADSVKVFDADWRLHDRFYASVRRHMRPGGVVVMAENCAGSDRDAFGRMIRAGGGREREAHVGTDIHGEPNGLYYQVSEW
jgi:SAM-dependent methyltransferase